LRNADIYDIHFFHLHIMYSRLQIRSTEQNLTAVIL